MADLNTPNRSSNMEKAEGERRTPEQGSVPDSESSTSRGYEDDGDNAGGITNRPLDEEMDNQNSLPQRGRSQAEERSESNEDLER